MSAELGFYEQRTDRNVGIIGVDGQQKLRNSTVAIAGCGGMGGMIADISTRNGIGRIKFTDCEDFDVSNLNRQRACKLATIGKSKAESTYLMVKELVGDDVEVDWDNFGVQDYNVDDFVSDADIIFDEIEFFQLRPRILLHQAARRHRKTVLNCNVVGYGTRIFKFTPESMTMEEFLDADENTEVTEDVVRRMLSRLAPRLPEDFSEKIIDDWIFRQHKAPIIGVTPPLSSSTVAIRAVLHLLDIEDKFGHVLLPAMPAYGYIDASKFEAGIHVGKWW
jgi:molybdopterin/thiamine biosynthesis adenylyltransferase